jgi:hypothetical protein
MRSFTPDPLGHDDDVVTESETLDEDELGVDPLKGGMDPPEDWSAATRYGTTPLEQATDRPLTERLAEERPDLTVEPPRDRPLAVTPLKELDDSVDEEVLPGEPVHGEGEAWPISPS